MSTAIQGAVFAAAFVSFVFSFGALCAAAERPRTALPIFAGFGILTGFLFGMGVSL